jgi:hypothetical protein
MTRYKHRKIAPLRILAMGLRGLGRLMNRWPLLLLVGFLISPVGPHLRVQYTYELRGSYRHMLDCDYLGSRGFITTVSYGECPLIVMLDARDFR